MWELGRACYWAEMTEEKVSLLRQPVVAWKAAKRYGSACPCLAVWGLPALSPQSCWEISDVGRNPGGMDAPIISAQPCCSPLASISFLLGKM